jgi:hypothetical protein
MGGRKSGIRAFAKLADVPIIAPKRFLAPSGFSHVDAAGERFRKEINGDLGHVPFLSSFPIDLSASE